MWETEKQPAIKSIKQENIEIRVISLNNLR